MIDKTKFIKWKEIAFCYRTGCDNNGINNKLWRFTKYKENSYYHFLPHFMTTFIAVLFIWEIKRVFNDINKKIQDEKFGFLNEEEKINLDFMDKCIFSDNQIINNASFQVMMLLIKLSNNIDSYSFEDVQKEKNKIYEQLNEEEKIIMDNFMISCINSMGIYSEESIKKRHLKKERKW